MFVNFLKQMVDERYLSVASMSSLPVEILLLLDISSIPTIQSRTCLLNKGRHDS